MPPPHDAAPNDAAPRRALPGQKPRLPHRAALHHTQPGL